MNLNLPKIFVAGNELPSVGIPIAWNSKVQHLFAMETGFVEFASVLSVAFVLCFQI
jgi:hypothetical protein